MVLHFLILSGEEEDFVREIIIDGDSSFLDLHNAIQESVGYDCSQLASFFTADEDWSKDQEIMMMQMDESTDALLMDQVVLNEFVGEPKDKLIYTFDFFGNRGFFVELLAVAEDKNLDAAAIVRSEGRVPLQVEDMEDPFDFEPEEEIYAFDEEDDMMEGYNDDDFGGFNEFEGMEEEW